MKINEALVISARELCQWGFVGVRTEIRPRLKRTLGQAEFRNGFPFKLALSEGHVIHSPDDEVIDTIRHEIAHFIAGANANHGATWKRACLRVGARPIVCGGIPAGMQFPLYVVCPLCWVTRVGYCVRPRRNLAKTGCKRCGHLSVGKLLLLTGDELEVAIKAVPMRQLTLFPEMER